MQLLITYYDHYDFTVETTTEVRYVGAKATVTMETLQKLN